jgi:hypothetical protein
MANIAWRQMRSRLHVTIMEDCHSCFPDGSFLLNHGVTRHLRLFILRDKMIRGLNFKTITNLVGLSCGAVVTSHNCTRKLTTMEGSIGVLKVDIAYHPHKRQQLCRGGRWPCTWHIYIVSTCCLAER